MKKQWKKLISAAMALLMMGCGKTADPDDTITGGRINMTDPDAPKIWITCFKPASPLNFSFHL